MFYADEPDVGLDIAGRNMLHEGFGPMHRGGIVLACHDENFIEVRGYATLKSFSLDWVWIEGSSS